MAETLFELLFKYRPVVYERGDLAFSAPAAWQVALAGGLVLLALLSYVRARGRSDGRDRAILAALRFLVLALAVGLLARPVLLISRVVPQENYLAVLVDDSRSMRIDDGVSRAGFVHDAFLADGSGVRSALERRFRVRTYRFSGSTGRVAEGEPLDFDGPVTRLGRALDAARAELSSLPLTALVLVTDGADQAADELESALLPLRAAGVPVFTVGVGSERFRRDIEVSAVHAPGEALPGSAVLAEVELRHTGFRGRTVPVVVERDGQVMGRREVRLGEDGSTTVRLDFEAGRAGAGSFLFRVPVQEGELVDRNNERDRTVMVRPGPQKVLYFEGEPRHEVAFLRRAVAEDDVLRLVMLQRGGNDRFLRLGVDSAQELAGGFPRTREELFSYRAVVLGSVEASAFSHDQLAMLEEFVAVRAGGLLVLGGRTALAEGGWAGTPVASALPVALDPAVRGDTGFHATAAVEPTREAARHPITRMEPGAEVTGWSALPALTVYNRTGPSKPGATVLLRAVADGDASSLPAGRPILATHRYGAGRAAVFAVQDSWLWQMHADIAVEDETHERLWRQLLRWLVAGSPDPVVAVTPAEASPPGEPVELRARVRDARFGAVNGAAVRALVTAPSGATREVPLEWTVGRDGEYAGRFTPDEVGVHDVEVRAAAAAAATDAARQALRVEPSRAEYFDAGMRRDVLERIAGETGGRFYAGDDVRRLPEDLTYSARGVTVIEELELWDMPATFLVFLVLLSVEWMYRRRRGLA